MSFSQKKVRTSPTRLGMRAFQSFQGVWNYLWVFRVHITHHISHISNFTKKAKKKHHKYQMAYHTGYLLVSLMVRGVQTSHHILHYTLHNTHVKWYFIHLLTWMPRKYNTVISLHITLDTFLHPSLDWRLAPWSTEFTLCDKKIKLNFNH